MARIVDDKHLVAVPHIASNDDDDVDDSLQLTSRESCISLSDILNANQLDMCFQSKQENLPLLVFLAIVIVKYRKCEAL